MSPTSATPGRMREVPLGAEPDATANAAWTSIEAASSELSVLSRRSKFGITGQEVLDSLRRCNKLTAHAEWAVSLLVEEAP